MTTTMIAPRPYFSVQAMSGNQYEADIHGFLYDVDDNDVLSLIANKCGMPISGSQGLIARLFDADLNDTSDQAFSMLVDESTYYRVTKITAKRASASVNSGVTGGIFTAASGGGDAVVASSQTFHGLTSGTLAVDLTIAATPAKTEYPGTTALYLNMTAPQGSSFPATCDLFVYGDLFS